MPSVRSMSLAMALLALVGISLVMTCQFLYPDLDSRILKVGSTDQYPPGSVTTFVVSESHSLQQIDAPQGRDTRQIFHIVRLDDGALIALSARNPHPRGCSVPWQPSFVFEGKTGWFHDPCLDGAWDISGRYFVGPTPRDLDFYPLQVVDGQITVDLTRSIWGTPRARRWPQ